jgi:hypothetical protein
VLNSGGAAAIRNSELSLNGAPIFSVSRITPVSLPKNTSAWFCGRNQNRVMTSTINPDLRFHQTVKMNGRDVTKSV